MGAFFGRAPELAALRDASRRALDDRRPTAVLVEGDPGSGKTRLLAEFLTGLPTGSTISTACFQPESRLPLSLGWTLAGELVTAEAQPADWTGALEAIHREVSLRAPLAIAVDDVQWCDTESLGLLHYLGRAAAAQDEALLLVLAGRSSSPVTTLTTSLRYLLDDAFVHLRLGPLDDDAAVALVRSVDSGLDREQARALASRAGGWPFWCEFLATTPKGDNDLVADRLATMSGDAHDVLSVIVLLARPTEVRDLAEILRWPDDRRVAVALDELVGTGLVARRGGTVQLTHDLVRTAVDSQLSGTGRIRELIASWLENRAGDDVTRLLAAAQHRSAIGLPTVQSLERVLTSPTRRMVGLDGLQVIVDLVDEVPVDDPSSVDLDRGTASLAAELGQHSVANERWVRVARRLADPAERARAWLGASEAAQHLEDHDAARRHLDEARRVAPDGDPILSVELDMVEARLRRWLEHDPDASRKLTTQALEQVRRLVPVPPVDAYVRALELACVDAMQRNAADEILPLAEELSDVAAGAGVRASVQARLRGGSALMLMGRLEAAERDLARAWADARRSYLTDLALDVGSWLAWTRYLRGRLPEAEEVAAECIALATRLGERTRPALMVEHWGRLAEISRGNHDKAIAALRAAADEESDPHHRVGTRQAIATWLARLDGAAAADEVVASLDAARSDADSAGCVRCRTELFLSGADALARIGEQERAETWLGSGRSDVGGGALQEWLLARAEASVAMAGTSEAADHLRRAIEGADRVGLGLEAIWARLDLGRTLLTSDSHRAAATLQEAVRLAEIAGAATETRLLTQLLRQIGIRTWHRAAADQPLLGLSPREQEIAALIAEGATNLDIARSLFLSRKTVERHVSNIFVKLAVKNRAQLAALVSSSPERVRAETL
jgi:DNA-binding CsgD family transcriptional regulator